MARGSTGVLSNHDSVRERICGASAIGAGMVDDIANEN